MVRRIAPWPDPAPVLSRAQALFLSEDDVAGWEAEALPLYEQVPLGALTFVLQSLGNIAVMALLFLGITAIAGGRLQRWLALRPERLARLNATVLITAGVFLVAYWCIRLPAYFGIGWWPKVPWS